LRWVVRAVLVLLLLVATALTAGAVYQALGASRDRESFPPPGRMVDVGGRSLHLVCRGEGVPVVMLEAGAQDWSTGWQRPQAAISEFTRVCAYDRAGVGWSDPSADPKDGLHMVADLRRLLEAADIERPVVIVGHSLGGMLARIYYEEHPGEVAGIVLAEPGDPPQILDMFGGGEDVAFGGWIEPVARFAARVGLVRWMYRDLMEGKGYPAREVAETRARLALPDAVESLASTIRHLPLTAVQTRANRSLGDIPVVVVRSENFDEAGVVFDDEAERQQFRDESMAAWDALVALSTDGRGPVVIPGANHITMVRDDAHWGWVVDAIREVVDAARARAAPPPVPAE
jgi:pimeloyl-ACP methyl ester carboxylesterase